MVKLFWQSPLARSLDAQTVYREDDFDYAYGLEPEADPQAVTEGRPRRGHRLVRGRDDDQRRRRVHRHVPQPTSRRSASGPAPRTTGPWKTDYDAMARKTAIRQLFKLLPKSAELTRAMAADEGVRSDWSEDAIDMQPDYPDAVAGEVERDDVDPATGEVQHQDGERR